ncbi:SDR family oxidoreductase [Arthrobacter sp. LAPM80]|uniref:SDR family oxidoreductase n=1 Tax=Arthrobacter sp. LAPM80 TaxID=3141788 RepID=UPI00398B5C39
MVLIAVAGGTGTAGRAAVEQAVASGCAVRSLSRHLPAEGDRVGGADYAQADFRTGQGVAAGLAGVDALIETLDARSGAPLRALPVTSVAVLAAAARAGVSRCVLLTIVRAAECSMGYYQVQGARALSYESAAIPTTVVYATQFHNLVAGIFAAGGKVGVVPVLRGVSFQPISTSDVASVLVQEALAGGDEHRKVVIGGPEIKTMKELAQEWQSATGSKAVVTGLPFPGSFGAFLRAGKNLVPEHAIGRLGFGEWLRARP